MKKNTLIPCIVMLLIFISVFGAAARPGSLKSPDGFVTDYLCEKMNSLITRNVDSLDKYYSNRNMEERKYLLFTKQQLLQDFLVAYASNNYTIEKVFPTVRVLNVETQNGSARITALLTAHLHWNAQNSSGSPVIGIISENHQLCLSMENDHWIISSDKFETDRGSSEESINAAYDKLSNTVDQLKKEAVASLERAKSSRPGNIQLIPKSQAIESESRTIYNRDEACNWAQKYWKNYSAEFVNLGDQEWEGGDCTNFVSQCMRAGGAGNDAQGNFQWYYIRKGNTGTKGDSYSWTWATARGLNSVLTGNHSKKEFGPRGLEKVITGDTAYNSELGQFVTPGDIIQYQFTEALGLKHSAIIVGMVYNSGSQRYEPVIATHSFDSWNLPWAKNAYKTHFIHITGVNQAV